VGKTTGSTTDKQGLDYVQYMMDRVTIPLVVPVKEANLKYAITPDGHYDETTQELLEALMSPAHPEAPIYEGTGTDPLGVHEVISYHEPVSRWQARTFEKLLLDYQSTEDMGKVKDERPVTLGLPLAANQLDKTRTRYTLITREVLLGVNDDTAKVANADPTQASPIALDGEFTKTALGKDIGLVELFKSYDWDGDGVSNIAEVENATQYDTHGNIIQAQKDNIFNPLNIIDSTIGNTLKSTYSRGYVAVGNLHTAPMSRGLGELSSSAGVPTGLRIPTFAPGLYDFVGNNQLNTDSYTSLRVLNLLEAAGRRWSEVYPDVYPLETNPKIHNVVVPPGQTSPTNTGNKRFGINDISGKSGGINSDGNCNVWPRRTGRNIPYTCLGHVSHQSGLDMDIRYVHKTATEAVLVVQNSNLDADATIELINLITDNGHLLDLLIVGQSMSQEDRAKFDNAFPDQIIDNLGHNNHVHLRLTHEQGAYPDPSQLNIVSATTLGFVPNNSAASTHEVTFQIFDRNNNPLLPWTKINFVTQNINVANSNGLNLVNDNQYDSSHVWVNINNQPDHLGMGKLNIECRAVGTTKIRLTDSRGNDAGTIPIECQ